VVQLGATLADELEVPAVFLELLRAFWVGSTGAFSCADWIGQGTVGLVDFLQEGAGRCNEG
jgi:hypothetical protein